MGDQETDQSIPNVPHSPSSGVIKILASEDKEHYYHWLNTAVTYLKLSSC